MTGLEHYREAERLIAAAKSEDRANQEGFSYWRREDLIALAQAHASLASAAAQAFAATEVPVDGETARQWRRAICAPRLTGAQL